MNKKILLAFAFLLPLVFPMGFVGRFTSFLPECRGGEVQISKIIQIESSGEPRAHNKKEDARGLMQIRPITLEEWNNFHPQDRHTPEELFKPEINLKIGTWYINKRVPQMLAAGNFQDTIENRIVCFNRGYSNFKNWHRSGQDKDKLPYYTKRYLGKYFKGN